MKYFIFILSWQGATQRSCGNWSVLQVNPIGKANESYQLLRQLFQGSIAIFVIVRRSSP